jgi:hypothetical protein
LARRRSSNGYGIDDASDSIRNLYSAVVSIRTAIQASRTFTRLIAGGFDVWKWYSTDIAHDDIPVTDVEMKRRHQSPLVCLELPVDLRRAAFETLGCGRTAISQGSNAVFYIWFPQTLRTVAYAFPSRSRESLIASLFQGAKVGE